MNTRTLCVLFASVLATAASGSVLHSESFNSVATGDYAAGRYNDVGTYWKGIADADGGETDVSAVNRIVVDDDGTGNHYVRFCHPTSGWKYGSPALYHDISADGFVSTAEGRNQLKLTFTVTRMANAGNFDVFSHDLGQQSGDGNHSTINLSVQGNGTVTYAHRPVFGEGLVTDTASVQMLLGEPYTFVVWVDYSATGTDRSDTWGFTYYKTSNPDLSFESPVLNTGVNASASPRMLVFNGGANPNFVHGDYIRLDDIVVSDDPHVAAAPPMRKALVHETFETVAPGEYTVNNGGLGDYLSYRAKIWNDGASNNCPVVVSSDGNRELAFQHRKNQYDNCAPAIYRVIGNKAFDLGSNGYNRATLQFKFRREVAKGDVWHYLHGYASGGNIDNPGDNHAASFFRLCADGAIRYICCTTPDAANGVEKNSANANPALRMELGVDYIVTVKYDFREEDTSRHYPWKISVATAADPNTVLWTSGTVYTRIYAGVCPNTLVFNGATNPSYDDPDPIVFFDDIFLYAERTPSETLIIVQ